MKLAKITHEPNKNIDWDYELLRLQHDLLAIQRTYVRQGHRAIILFEGWDAAGKGGIIRRLTEKLDPRGFDVHQIGKPNHEEQSRHYLYRFWQHVPKPGRIEIFDRSWYGRVLVERVEQFCSTKEWQRAYQEINELEQLLCADGIRLIKIFLHITNDEQLRRFKLRYENPLKRWKLTVEDFRNREKWEQYLEATEDMLENCSHPIEWKTIGANHKKWARISALSYIADRLSDGVDISPPAIQPGVEAYAKRLF